MFKVWCPEKVEKGVPYHISYHARLMDAEVEAQHMGVGYIISELNLDLIVNSNPIAPEGEPQCQKRLKK